MFQPALYNCTRFERGFWGFAISRHCWRSNKLYSDATLLTVVLKKPPTMAPKHSIAISIKQIADNNKLVTSIQAWRTMESVSTSWDYVKGNQWKLLECYYHWMNSVLFCHLRLGWWFHGTRLSFAFWYINLLLMNMHHLDQCRVL